jgi:hypothetical protein
MKQKQRRPVAGLRRVDRAIGEKSIQAGSSLSVGRRLPDGKRCSAPSE